MKFGITFWLVVYLVLFCWDAFGTAQLVEIESVDAAGRRVCVHARQMQLHKRLCRRAGKIINTKRDIAHATPLHPLRDIDANQGEHDFELLQCRQRQSKARRLLHRVAFHEDRRRRVKA